MLLSSVQKVAHYTLIFCQVATPTNFNNLTILLQFIHTLYAYVIVQLRVYINLFMTCVVEILNHNYCNNLPTMLALCLMLSGTYYAKNYIMLA